mgnify:FL=1
MSNTLMGSNEAENRLRRSVGQVNTGRIEYPKGTNERGSSGREYHAAGDVVGMDERENHARGDMVGKKKGCSVGNEGSAPGRGGSRMSSHYGEPDGGRQMGAPRHMAAKQAHAENHAAGDMVGNGTMISPRPVAMNGAPVMDNARIAPQPLRRGGKAHPHHHRYER